MTTELISSSCSKHRSSQVILWPWPRHTNTSSKLGTTHGSGVQEPEGPYQGAEHSPSAQDNGRYTVAQRGQSPRVQAQT